jgi:mRNA interferase MazF
LTAAVDLWFQNRHLKLGFFAYPCEARVTVEGKESKAMADQIMTVSKVRLSERLGLLSPDQMRAVDMAMRIQLGLAA